MDEFLSWLSSKAPLIIAIQSAITGVIMVILSGVGAEPPHTFKEWVKILSIGICVSVLVGWVVSDYLHSEALRHAVIGSCAVVSRDILAAAQALGRKFGKDPFGTIDNIRHHKGSKGE